MLENEVLVVECAAVDALASGAVALGEVAALAHELRNDAVKRAAFVAEALLVSAQLAKVLDGHWHHVGAQLDDEATGLALADRDVEVDARVVLELLCWQALGHRHGAHLRRGIRGRRRCHRLLLDHNAATVGRIGLIIIIIRRLLAARLLIAVESLSRILSQP